MKKMKNKNEHIEEKVNKALGFLENPEKIEANPFFYTRLEAKLQEQKEKKPFFNALFSVHYNLKPALIGLILIINIISVSILIMNNETSSNRSNEISNLMETYAFDQSDYIVLTSNEE